jgi:hypothetical protein
MKILNKFYPHFLAIFGFVIVALIYFYPVLQGKALYQSDIAQYTGMAKEQNDFRQSDKVEPYWTNSAFGGMPTYQLGANYPHNYIKKLDSILRFLPRPADYLFLYFLGFYALLLVLKTDPLKAFIGALAFGFSTYLIIILGVGHNAKAHAIAYMPLVVAGTILIFRKKFVVGGLITMLAVALEINANHFQMTYYLLILLLVITIYFTYKFIKEKEYKSLLIAFGTFAVAGIFAIGANAANLLATAEFTEFSIRGKSELTFNADGSKNQTSSAMNYDYITEYSYGIAESFNLIAPKLFGGSNSEPLDKKSNVVSFLQTQQIAENEYISEAQAIEYAASGMPTYWGDQPIVAAPAYIGIIVFFLCVFGLLNDNRKIKYVFLAGAIVSLLLSWGKNFPILTDFFIEFVPFYDKFRAVSSVQVVLELCIPVLAIMGLHSFFKSDKNKQWQSLWRSAAVVLGILVILLLSKELFEFSSINDDQLIKSMDPKFVDALKLDRKSMYVYDLLRSGFLVLVVFLVLWLHIKNKLSQTLTVILIGILMVGDLIVIDKNYLDAKKFVSAREVREPFQPTAADLEILKDTSVYRVYDIQGRLQARTSYFHKSIGGYSAVRSRRLDQLFEYQIEKDLSNLAQSIDSKTLMFTKNNQVIDALNIKYIIVPVEGGEVPVINPYANGNAWFVNEVQLVNVADDEMKALNKTDLKKVAVVNSKFKDDALFKNTAVDSLASISLAVYKPNYLKYTSSNTKEGVAVFSEIYYPNGWKVTIDGKPSNHFQADFVLRAMKIPAGKHTIEFKFEPQVVKTGSTIALFSSIGMFILISLGIYLLARKHKEYNLNIILNILFIFAAIHYFFERIAFGEMFISLFLVFMNSILSFWLLNKKIFSKFLYRDNFSYTLIIYLLVFLLISIFIMFILLIMSILTS